MHPSYDGVIFRIDGLAQDPRPSGSRKLHGEQNLWRIQLETTGLFTASMIGNGLLMLSDAKDYPASARMTERLASPQGKAQYRRRKAIVEPVFGWIKHVLGFRQFSVRGLNKVVGEWNLVCLAINLRRMWALQS